MLGLARASEYAGWWNSSPRWSATGLFDIVQTNKVSPRYYADFTGMTEAMTSGQVAIADISSGSTAIDMTSVPNFGRRQVHALTFKVGTNWLATPGASYTPAFRDYHQFFQNGTQINQYSYCAEYNSEIIFGVTFDQFTGISLSTSAFAPYRNRWLGLICATSETTASFSNWTGTGSNTYNNCARIYLVDIEAKTVIATVDKYAYADKTLIDLTQSWSATNAGSPTYYDQRIATIGNNTTDIASNGRDEFEHLSSWMSIGETLDPAVYWSQLIGEAPADTVGGVRAWSTLRLPTAGSAVTGVFGTYGYIQSTPGSYRWPANTQWAIEAPSTQILPTPPVYTQY